MPLNQVTSRGWALKLTAPRSLYFLIFTISGFSGLIYESIWSHYLKLFLGHAAYAQTLVLIIFMGGMALGSWIASRFSAKSKSPLLIYAAVELIIGVAALLFHDLFTSLIEVFYASVLPSIGSPAGGTILKWLAASVLIMPQSILLGMTFPMMSAGIIRRYPDTPGGSIAMLYFTNSIGAAVGVLASGFWLIKLVGLPGTILSAGLLNIVLATTVWALVRLDPSPYTPPIKSEASIEKASSLKSLFLVAAFITGAASFIYEISWIRMLSLVLGATTHSFELMLSAFITGLAFGGLWIKRRIDRIDSPVRFSGYVQLIMGILALLTIPVYLSSFGWMEWLLSALSKTDAGYTSYSFASHAIALSVMLPTTFMAGMTLPLFTFVLIRQGHGEASIGQIYAANNDRRHRRRACRGAHRLADPGGSRISSSSARDPRYRSRHRLAGERPGREVPLTGIDGGRDSRRRGPGPDDRDGASRSQAPDIRRLSQGYGGDSRGGPGGLLPGRQDCNGVTGSDAERAGDSLDQRQTGCFHPVPAERTL